MAAYQRDKRGPQAAAQIYSRGFRAFVFAHHLLSGRLFSVCRAFMKPNNTIYLLQVQLQRLIDEFIRTGEAHGEYSEIASQLMQVQSEFVKLVQHREKGK
tara:strand:- start:1618 stop:1917 length:300 start_codon:yes stop_codon:yes gene_type:complete